MNDSFQPMPPAHVRQGPDTEAARQLLRDSALEWFEREDGLPVVGFRIDSPTGLANEVDWHTHGRAQLICVESGLLTTRTRHGTWSLAPGSAGWMPAAEPHTVAIDGPLRGWGMVLAPALCHDLPADPCVIGISPLLQAVALRVCDWPIADAASARQQHLIEVLLDEIRAAPRQRMHLPMPRDRRLLKIASQLLAEPADDRSLAQWAAWAGLSTRSLTRHFREETTLSFAHWRQQARLAEALRQLSEGRAVSDIAHALGFSSSSAFVTVFRRHFGVPPGRYLARAGRGLDPPRGLASPAASG
ncbi:AraC family transcriptional regulator [Stenotrophomonas chelatiphaga]|jgi:AraC-like DNA-binding protein|uniref:AraC family transcriptional regulator n=1 Tax=Stenotrophomonas chelatiphaga TaxID=517011 RepID=A0A0R0DCP6_9GAMM|nr:MULTISPECIES: helix-turn-helix transcriptional regulator [Stenotrophomonas]KRG74760.1 AraC family transcriptional regulator [Stenotrophomonas chelatiphaga]MCS4230183.1 AraC-like DNA-binding protein [Stenotrophomonas chelatiphaga]MDR6095193.1 AraC-like DNA-binding protein [Stenotrophomonas sp. SORGH_AS_0321]ROQ43717.1 AraC family transcriptional regulator [Stenotrophomonas maltophilia]